MKKQVFQKCVLICLLLTTTACFDQKSSAVDESTTTTAARSVASMALISDIPIDTFDCTFNGATILDGSPVTAYQNSSVAFGESCISESRVCSGGTLSGSYQYAACDVGAPASCLFNGETINHGESITGYTTSTVPFGQVCSANAETRTCNNGALSGSAAFTSCDVNVARACLFDGKTISHGNSAIAFLASTSQFGGACTQESRVCNDGTLSGSYMYGSCAVDQPASCLFDGRTLAHGEQVVAFQSSSTQFGASCTQENRICDNGVLSGTYLFGSCSINLPAACSFDNKTVNHLESVIAYQSATVAFGGTCVSEARSCANGQLSGSFDNAACVVDTPADCTLNGRSLSHGSSTTTYVTATVPAGQTCLAQTRTCTNGILSGSSVIESCSVDPIVITDPPKTCQFGGSSYASDTSVTAFESATVAFGETCKSESRQCLNGVFTGSYTNASCSVSAAVNCTLNGKSVNHNSSVTVFTSASVASGQVCQSEVRTCTNGQLSGSAVAESCVVQNPPPPPPPIDPGTGGNSCQQTAIIWEFPKECRGKCGKGNGYFKSRISRDGGKTWLTIQKNKLPEDLNEIWTYMIKKNGKNACGRPNVDYANSKNSGYVILQSTQIPDCKICKYVEVETQDRGHGMCHKKQEKKKVIKFLCQQPENKDKKHHHGHDEHEDKDHDDDDDRNAHHHDKKHDDKDKHHHGK